MISPPPEATPDIGDDPPRRHPPEKCWASDVEVAVSQPIFLSDAQDALRSTFILADLEMVDSANRFSLSSIPDAVSPAQFVNRIVVDGITHEALRPPEVILRGPWDKVDIWTFGCLVRPSLCFSDKPQRILTCPQ